MPRFIYSASGIAVAGRFRRPLATDLDPMAACVLPSVGGRVTSRAGAFRLADPASGELMLAFDSAETVIESSEAAPGVFTTVLRTTVRGLNVGNILKADEVVGALHLRYNRSGRSVSIDTSGSGFRGLVLAGQAFAVTVDHGLGREAADYAKFRRDHPELPESHGATRYSLARHPALKFQFPEHGYLDWPDFGRVYFCEWSAAPYTQSLTMLRLRLGSPQEGELEIGRGEGDGQDYP